MTEISICLECCASRSILHAILACLDLHLFIECYYMPRPDHKTSQTERPMQKACQCERTLTGFHQPQCVSSKSKIYVFTTKLEFFTQDSSNTFAYLCAKEEGNELIISPPVYL